MSSFPALKDPQDVDQLSIEWHEWIGSDTISTSTWSVDAYSESPSALIIDGDSIATFTDSSPVRPLTVANVVVSGGTMGVMYTLRNHIVTTAGLEYDRSISVKMIQQ